MQAELIVWPGGEHVFALRMKELRRLQDACNCGPAELMQRLRLGTWRVDDVYQTLRLGLIGGGMDDGEVTAKLTAAFDAHPLNEFVLPALAVVALALMGPAPVDESGDDPSEDAPPEKPLSGGISG